MQQTRAHTTQEVSLSFHLSYSRLISETYALEQLRRPVLSTHHHPDIPASGCPSSTACRCRGATGSRGILDLHFARARLAPWRPYQLVSEAPLNKSTYLATLLTVVHWIRYSSALPHDTPTPLLRPLSGGVAIGADWTQVGPVTLKLRNATAAETERQAEAEAEREPTGQLQLGAFADTELLQLQLVNSFETASQVWVDAIECRRS